MTVTVYNTQSEANQIPKDLQKIAELSGTARDEIDVIHPSVRIAYGSGAIDCNYAYIAEFNRYYFIREYTQVRAGVVELQLEVDVLQTFYPQFIGCDMIASRSDSHFNVYAPDPDRQYYQYKSSQYITLGDVGVPSALVIATVG